jgi:hypothetical protein
MNEKELRTRAGVFGTAILLALVIDIARLPLILLIVPLVILFLGLIAGAEDVHAAWYGMLSTMGIFEPAILSDPERVAYAQRRDYFWFGEVASAAVLAGIFTVPVEIFLAVKTTTAFAFTGAAMIFLLLFIFLPKLIRQAMKTDTEMILDVFGKNEQFRKVFWTVFITLAGLVLAHVVDPATADSIVRMIAAVIP